MTAPRQEILDTPVYRTRETAAPDPRPVGVRQPVRRSVHSEQRPGDDLRAEREPPRGHVDRSGREHYKVRRVDRTVDYPVNQKSALG
jgi:hypothetical protein